MMIAKVFSVLMSVALAIVTIDAVVNNSGCGRTDLSIYSNSIHHGQWPFVASIYHVFNDKIQFICGGTIVSKFAIMTGE